MGMLSLCDVCIRRELYAERRVVGGTATSITFFLKCDVDPRKCLYAVCRVVGGTAVFHGLGEPMT